MASFDIPRSKLRGISNELIRTYYEHGEKYVRDRTVPHSVERPNGCALFVGESKGGAMSLATGETGPMVLSTLCLVIVADSSIPRRTRKRLIVIILLRCIKLPQLLPAELHL